jgi:hypothetical protein
MRPARPNGSSPSLPRNINTQQYWPAQYIVDQSGKIVFEYAGEGQYDEMERVVRKLLDLTS